MDDPRIEAFYAEASPWRETLATLRRVLRRMPLTEEFKWRSPCYCYDGGNVAIVWDFKDACVLGFFKGTLLPDPAAILLAPGENSRAVRMVKFTSTEAVEQMEPTLRAYLFAAIELEKSGAKVTFAKDDLDWPPTLITRLDADPALLDAFQSLTPGRQRGWVLHFSQAVQPATQATRIEKAVPKILAGKGRNDP